MKLDVIGPQGTRLKVVKERKSPSFIKMHKKGFSSRVIVLWIVAIVIIVISLISPIFSRARTILEQQGGYRFILELEASHVTFEITQDNVENTWWGAIVPKLEDNLCVSIKTISLDPTTRQAVAEIGRPITENLLEAITGDLGSVVKIEKAISDETRDDVISMLQARVDLYGTLDAQFRPLGVNLVLFEVAGLSPEQAEILLSQSGRFELFFENEILLRGEDIVSVDAPYPSGEWAQTANLPFRLTDDGAARFSAAAAGKANYPTIIYVDRPTGAIVVFDNEILGELPASLEYDPDEKMFKGGTIEGMEYLLHVSAIGSAKDELSPQAQQFLEEQAGLKLRVLLLGDFSSDIIENLSTLYTVESISRLSEENAEEWVKRACGVKSVVTISPSLAADLADGKITKDLMITITRPSLEEAMTEARNLQVILSQRLPVEISFESSTYVPPRPTDDLTFAFSVLGVLAGIVLLTAGWHWSRAGR